MSPATSRSSAGLSSFPRASGDEPSGEKREWEGELFSPREWG